MALFFIFTIGVLRSDRRAIALALVVFLLYGGMVWGVFPSDPAISYESHLAGALAGVALPLAARRLDPPPTPKRYSWEEDRTPERARTGERAESTQQAEATDEAEPARPAGPARGQDRPPEGSRV